MLKASFIIPSYNSFKTISKTLESIFNLKNFSSVQEIIIVDSSESKSSWEPFQSKFAFPLTIVKLPRKSIPAKARNIGAEMAIGDILCFIDSDVYLDETWLEEVFLAYARGHKVGSGSIDVPDFQRDNELALAQLYLQFNEFLPTQASKSMTLVPSCNMFVERNLFEQTKGFPLIRASEDVLFCLECSQYTPVWFLPQARCFHIFRLERNSFLENQKILGQHILKYRRLFYQKWYYHKPWVSLFLPVFFMIKFVRIVNRIMKAGSHHVKNFILVFPAFWAGLYYWGFGFYTESLVNEEGIYASN